MNRRGILSLLGLSLLVALFAMAFQACTYNKAIQNPQDRNQAEGGGGVEGLRYISYAICPSNQVGIHEAIYFSPDGKTANLVWQNCQTVAHPQPIDVANLNYFVGGTKGFQYGGQLYDQQAYQGTQRVTLKVCRGSDVEVDIWENYGSPTTLFGSVSEASGSSSGPLNIDSSDTVTSSHFSTVTGQPSLFDLNVASGTLSYSINGAKQKTVTNLTCGSQSVPPSPPVGAGLPLDSNGWSLFTASSDSRTIYVSSGSGSDANNGLSSKAPVQTIAKAMSLMRPGYPDWVLLKRGDVWSGEGFGNLCGPGRSAMEPALISAYGTGARPLIKVPSSFYAGISTGGASCRGNPQAYLAMSSLELYAYDRDPDSSQFNSNTVNSSLAGANFNGSLGWILIEDCKFSFFVVGLNVSPSGPAMSDAISVRRNVVVDAYGAAPNSHGLYIWGMSNILIEENIFDHNGWNSSVAPLGAPQVGDSDVWVADFNGPVHFVGNILSQAASYGADISDNGLVDNNLFVRNPIGLLLNGLVPGTVSNSVFVESDDFSSSQGRGYGIDIAPSGGAPLRITNNILTQVASVNPYAFGISIESNTQGVTVSNNAICLWTNPTEDYGSENMFSQNTVDASSCDGLGFTNPNLSVESYDSSLGGPGTLVDLLSRARAQSKDNWNTALMANSINNYLRAGFGK